MLRLAFTSVTTMSKRWLELPAQKDHMRSHSSMGSNSGPLFRRSKTWWSAVVALVLIGTAVTISPTPAWADPRCPNDDPWYEYCVGGAILVEYRGAGDHPFFGNAVTPENDAARGGRWQAFERGSSIYWHPLVSDGHANQIGGLIRDKWGELGWENGFLAYPVTRELQARKPGRLNHFEGGSIYWSNATGAHNIQGVIRDKWASLDWENGRLGFPSSDEFATRANGAGQHLEGGELYWSPNTGAHPVWGAIRDQWVATGWENGRYGYPRSDEVNGGNASSNPSGFEGKCQIFENDAIIWGFSLPLHDSSFSSVSVSPTPQLSIFNRSKYTAAVDSAVDQWNSKGRVQVVKSGDRPPVLQVVDENRSDVSYVGLYVQASQLKFNSFYMDQPGYTDDMDRNVVLHEMGHALGLRHSCENNIMLARVTPQTQFGTIDNSSYEAMWGVS